MKIERVVFSSSVSLPGIESGRGLSQTDHGVMMEFKDGMLRVHGAPPRDRDWETPLSLSS